MRSSRSTLEFMLTTSITDTICGDLADRLLAGTGAAHQLEALERVVGFIFPLDERREWYRYHPLLAEVLRMELGRRRPDELPELHRRAARWYAEQGDADRAVRHAVAGNDVELAAQVVGASYLHMLEEGRIATILAWLTAIGPAAVESDRRLAVVEAWTMHFMGRHREGDVALAAALQAPAKGPSPDGASSIEATSALMVAAFPGGDVGVMLENAHRAFELEAERDTQWRPTVHVLLGFALVRAGRYMEALEPLKKGAALAVEAESWLDAVGSRTVLRPRQFATGEIARAEHLAREALEMARRHGLLHTSTGAYGRAMLGMILTRRGDAAAGEPLIAQALPAVRSIDEPLALAEVLIALALARRALGHRRSARALLREANVIVDACRDPGVLRTHRPPARRPTGCLGGHAASPPRARGPGPPLERPIQARGRLAPVCLVQHRPHPDAGALPQARRRNPKRGDRPGQAAWLDPID